MLCRLSIVLGAQLLIWDTQGSKFLLNTRVQQPENMSFSSNGHFFAFILKNKGEVCVWRKAPPGYTLHQKLVFPTRGFPTSPHLSPNGGSFIILFPPTIHLWYTKDPIFPSCPTTDTASSYFILGFSPNRALVAFARLLGDTVTILDLNSGRVRLVIDAGMEIRHLGTAESTIVIVDKRKMISWTLDMESAKANINDSIRITTFDLSPPSNGQEFVTLLLSPDLSHIATSWFSQAQFQIHLEIYDVFNGKCLAVATPNLGMLKSLSTSHELKGTNTSEFK